MRTELQSISDRFFMAFCLWREARNEPREGKVALAFSILNRVQNPKWWGSSINSVITKPWQYSSFTDPNDKQLIKYPQDGTVWEECLDVACKVIDGLEKNPVPGADSYYATYIPKPKWAQESQFVAQIGGHRFYNTDGDHPDNVRG